MAADAEKLSDYLERLYPKEDARNSSGVLRKKCVERISSYLKGGHDPNKKFTQNNAYSLLRA